MTEPWNTSTLDSVDDLFRSGAQQQADGWLFRGHGTAHGTLTPSIDRGSLWHLNRRSKLDLEGRAIETFRTFALHLSEGEAPARTDNFVALMVLRHHGTPTRLLDWSKRWAVAAYFAAAGHQDSDGEIWAFSEPAYRPAGEQQWRDAPENTNNHTGDAKDFNGNLTFFAENPSDWFMCLFYEPGFPRQYAQRGAYTAAAHFSRDHKDLLQRLVPGRHRHRYILPARKKAELLRRLRDELNISRGPLFPDTAGAAFTAAMQFPTP
jgi:hypothetical protein